MAPRDRLSAMSDVQLQISSFEPHHSVAISYPHFEELRDSELFCLRVPEHADNSYELLPLICDDAVANHSGRYSREETSILTRTRAEKVLKQEPVFSAGAYLPTLDQLHQIMEQVGHYVGYTTLKSGDVQNERRWQGKCISGTHQEELKLLLPGQHLEA